MRFRRLRVSRTVDLTGKPRERVPTDRAELRDIEVAGTISVFGIKLQLKVRDRLGVSAEAVVFAISAFVAVVLSGFAFVMCRLAGAPNTTTLWASLILGLVGMAPAIHLFIATISRRRTQRRGNTDRLRPRLLGRRPTLNRAPHRRPSGPGPNTTPRKPHRSPR